VTWVKLDDRFDEHPKVVGLSEPAFRAFVSGLCYCARNLTDGHITDAALRRITRRPVVNELLEVGLWEQNGNGVHIHDYLDFQPSSERILSRRRADSERKRSGKDTDS